MKRVTACAVLCLAAVPQVLGTARSSNDLSEYTCLVSAVWHEARGEPPIGQRAVIDVIYNRAVESGKSICDVVSAPKQFPWYEKKGLVLTEEAIAVYTSAVVIGRVLPSSYIYFNRGPVHGVKCRKIGYHKFCRSESAKRSHG